MSQLTIHRSDAVTRRRFGILCVLTYVAVSWAFRFDMRLGRQIESLVYPFDTFSMYASMPSRVTSHLLIRDQHGEIHRVESYGSFDCSEPLSGENSLCQDSHGFLYHFEDLIHYIEDHSGPGQEPVELIARTWKVNEGTTPSLLGDCVVAHCKVAR